MQNVNADKFQS